MDIMVGATCVGFSEHCDTTESFIRYYYLFSSPVSNIVVFCCNFSEHKIYANVFGL